MSESDCMSLKEALERSERKGPFRSSKEYKAVLRILLLFGILFLHTYTAWGASAGKDKGWWHQDDSGKWYYYDGDGSLRTGWIFVGEKYYYLYEDGHCAISEVTPDGFRVDENGGWYEMEKNILGQKFSVLTRFMSQDQAGEDWGKNREALEETGRVVSEAFGGSRKLAVTAHGIEYISTEDGTTYLGLYKEPTGGYRMDVRLRLDRSAADLNQASTYDYAVFEVLATVISSTPDQLSEAVLNSWQEENIYGISRTAYTEVGDCSVRYESGQGYGKFYIK